MRKLLKSFTCLLLVFVFCFSFTGCTKELIFVPLIDFGTQPAVDGSEGSFASYQWTADEIINNLYEPLREQNPNYITRTNLGKEESGTYDMWEYVFTPENPVQTVWIDTGMHSREKDSMFAVARIMHLITNEYQGNEALTYLREKVKFVIIPIVNPWGISEPRPKNDNVFCGKNLNWTFNKDNKPVEAQVLLERFNLVKNELSFALDVHSTTNNTYGHYSYRYGNEEIRTIAVLDNVISQLVEKNVTGEADLHFIGKSNPACFTQVCYTNGFENIFTIEHSDYVWDDVLNTSLAMTKAVEYIGNCIYALAVQEL